MWYGRDSRRRVLHNIGLRLRHMQRSKIEMHIGMDHTDIWRYGFIIITMIIVVIIIVSIQRHFPYFTSEYSPREAYEKCYDGYEKYGYGFSS